MKHKHDSLQNLRRNIPQRHMQLLSRDQPPIQLYNVLQSGADDVAAGEIDDEETGVEGVVDRSGVCESVEVISVEETDGAEVPCALLLGWPVRVDGAGLALVLETSLSPGLHPRCCSYSVDLHILCSLSRDVVGHRNSSRPGQAHPGHQPEE